MIGINLICYEIWTELSDKGNYIITVWVECDDDANKIAVAMGGFADLLCAGIVRPE